MVTKTKKAKSSFFRGIVRAIIRNAKQGKPVDKATITKQASRTYRHKNGRNVPAVNSNYTTFAYVLHFVRGKVSDQVLFDQWADRTGLARYMNIVPLPRHSTTQIVFPAIYELASLFNPDSMGDWLTEVTAKLKGRSGPFTSGELQIARGQRGFFFVCLEELDRTRDPSWGKLRKQLPKHTIKRAESNPYKEKASAGAVYCSPIGWAGSKRNQIEPIFSLLDIPQCGTFLDAFCGSGIVALTVRERRPDVTCWINDASEAVYAYHTTLRDKPGFLTHKYYTETPDKARWREYKQRLAAGGMGDEEMAWLLFYVVTYSYHHLGGTFSPRFMCRPEAQMRKFFNCSRLLQGVKITCKDFREVVNECDVAYFDPPYGEQPCYYHPFNEKDDDALCSLLLQREKPWVLSYNDAEEVRDNYATAEIHTVKRKWKTELLMRGANDGRAPAPMQSVRLHLEA